MKTPEDAIAELEAAWSEPNGVLFRLRQGELNSDDLADLLALLRQIDINTDASPLPRRFVSLVWYLPLFVEWQRERVSEAGGDVDTVVKFANTFTNETERLLGVP
jgi:hypothetical protein